MVSRNCQPSLESTTVRMNHGWNILSRASMNLSECEYSRGDPISLRVPGNRQWLWGKTTVPKNHQPSLGSATVRINRGWMNMLLRILVGLSRSKWYEMANNDVLEQ